MSDGLPEPPGRIEISIAERHKRIIWYSTGAWFALGVTVGVFALPYLGIVVLAALVEPFVLAALLARRFTAVFVGANLTIEPSGRRPADEVGRHHRWFVTNGYTAAGPYVVVNSDDGTVLSRPNMAYHRPGQHHLAGAHVASVFVGGVQFVSALADGRWLVTSSAPVITHPRLVVQRAGAGDPGAVFHQHGQGLETLARRGIGSVDPGLAPLEVVLEMERLEQDRLRTHRENGGSLSSLVREAERVAVGTLSE